MFVALFLHVSPRILDLRYKIKYTFDYDAKFRGDRPTELGDNLAIKQKFAGGTTVSSRAD